MNQLLEQFMIAACFLRYSDALLLGDNYASDTSRTAFLVAYDHTTGHELEHMGLIWERERSYCAWSWTRDLNCLLGF